MSIECGECENDLRRGHDRDCSRWNGDEYECPVCEHSYSWKGEGAPYCGECAADNGRDVRMHRSDLR